VWLSVVQFTRAYLYFIHIQINYVITFQDCQYLGCRQKSQIGRYTVTLLQEKRSKAHVERSFSFRDVNNEVGIESTCIVTQTRDIVCVNSDLLRAIKIIALLIAWTTKIKLFNFLNIFILTIGSCSRIKTIWRPSNNSRSTSGRVIGTFRKTPRPYGRWSTVWPSGNRASVTVGQSSFIASKNISTAYGYKRKELMLLGKELHKTKLSNFNLT